MKIHFPGLNSIRFVAALMVLVSHIESFKAQRGLASIADTQFVGAMGQHGVKIFFVLSGFLIGYLLLAEHELKGKIDIKDFYIRRALRIWPLYYLIVIAGLIILPVFFPTTYLSGDMKGDFASKALWTIFFLPNVMQHFYGHILGLGVLWSIGVEEQFYLFFPWILKLMRKHFFAVITVLIVLIIAGKFVIAIAVQARLSDKSDILLLVSKAFLQFDAMLIGVLFGYIYKNRTFLLHILQSKVAEVTAIIAAIVLMWISPSSLFNPQLPIYAVANVLYGIPFGIIIMNIATNQNALIKFQVPFFETAGKWSYGIYMYHSIIVYIMVLYCGSYFKNNSLVLNVVVYGVSIVLTVGLAYYSFNYFENWFLKKKRLFSSIESES